LSRANIISINKWFCCKSANFGRYSWSQIYRTNFPVVMESYYL